MSSTSKNKLTKRSSSKSLLSSKVLRSKTSKTPKTPAPAPAQAQQGEKKVTFTTTRVVIPSVQTNPAPPPLQTVPQTVGLTVPATAPAQDQNRGGAQDLLQGVPKRTKTASGKQTRGRAGGTKLKKFSPQDVVDVADLESNEAMRDLQMQGVDEDRIRLAGSALLALNLNQMTQERLLRTIVAADTAYEAIKDLADNAALPPLPVDSCEIALAMRSRKRMEDALNAMVRTDQVHTLPRHQLKGLVDFLTANPGLASTLKAADIGFLFNSAGAKGQGGGVFKDGNIHTLGKGTLPARQWVQLVIHEAGHATYQRRILGEKSPPSFLDGGSIANLRAEITQLREAAELDGVELDDPNSQYNARYLAIQKEFDDNGARQIWSSLSPDARALYDAWGTLRENGGKDLQGVDMGPGMSPPERLVYQANNFIEFIAETFMQVATGEIQAHYQHITTDQSVSPEARAAWETAMEILDRHVRDSILGWRSMW